MLETGLRVGDAILFNPAHCRKGQALWCYTYNPQKQKRTAKQKTADLYLAEALKIGVEFARLIWPTLIV